MLILSSRLVFTRLIEATVALMVITIIGRFVELAAEDHFAVGNDPVGKAPSGPTFLVAGWRKRCVGKDLADNAALNKQFLYVIHVRDTYVSCTLLYQVFVLYFMNKFQDLNSNDLGERNQKCCGSFSEVPLVFSFNS